MGKGKSPLQIYNVGASCERVQMDILHPLSIILSRNKYLLVVVDCFTKWMEAFPLKNIRAKTIAESFSGYLEIRGSVGIFIFYLIHTD